MHGDIVERFCEFIQCEFAVLAFLHEKVAKAKSKIFVKIICRHKTDDIGQTNGPKQAKLVLDLNATF